MGIFGNSPYLGKHLGKRRRFLKAKSSRLEGGNGAGGGKALQLENSTYRGQKKGDGSF